MILFRSIQSNVIRTLLTFWGIIFTTFTDTPFIIIYSTIKTNIFSSG